MGPVHTQGTWSISHVLPAPFLSFPRFPTFPSSPDADRFPSGLLESRLESSAERLVMPLARPGEMGVAGCTEEGVIDPRYW